MIRKPPQTLIPFLLCLLLSSCGEHATMQMYTPNLPAARLNAQQGLHYLHNGYVDLAQEKLKLAMEQAPNDPLVLDSYAYLQEKMGMLDSANFYFFKAMVEAPESSVIKNNYGAFLCRNGYPSLAIQHFLKATETPNIIPANNAYTNARFCLEHLNHGLGDQAEYAYYTKLLWKPLPPSGKMGY